MDRRLFGKIALGFTAFASVIKSAFGQQKKRPRRRNRDVSKDIDPKLANFAPDTAQEQMKVIQAKRFLRKGRGEEGVCTSLLFFADIHLVTEHSTKIRAFYEKYQKFIDDPIHLGDTVGAIFREPFTTWDAFPRALNVIGNHDVYLKKMGNADMSDKCKYDTYFKKYNKAWGVVLPENAEEEGKCYWHKDYNGNVRVIGIDCMRLDATQLAWFKKLLAEAVEKKLKVLIATHIPPNCDKVLECNFSSLDNPAWTTKLAGSKDFVKAVDEFISAGGTFVCWMCGHLHHDSIMYASDSKNKQLVITMECATQFSDHTDAQHIRETATETCWQLVAIESESDVLKIARFGNCYDHYLRRKDTFCYDLKNHKIIWAS